MIRHWDQAQTPYQRLLATGILGNEQLAHAHSLYEQINPYERSLEIYGLLTTLWKLPHVATSVA